MLRRVCIYTFVLEPQNSVKKITFDTKEKISSAQHLLQVLSRETEEFKIGKEPNSISIHFQPVFEKVECPAIIQYPMILRNSLEKITPSIESVSCSVCSIITMMPFIAYFPIGIIILVPFSFMPLLFFPPDSHHGKSDMYFYICFCMLCGQYNFCILSIRSLFIISILV